MAVPRVTKAFFIRVLMHFAMYLFLNFLFMGVIYFNLEAVKGMSVLEQLVGFFYFYVSSVLTIGYGDFLNKEKENEDYHLYHLAGYHAIAPFGHIYLWEAIGAEFRNARLGIRQQYRLRFLGVLVIIFVLPGVPLIMYCEETNLENAVYLLVTSWTTIGYGNVSFTHFWGQVFAVIWLPVVVFIHGGLMELWKDRCRIIARNNITRMNEDRN